MPKSSELDRAKTFIVRLKARIERLAREYNTMLEQQRRETEQRREDVAYLGELVRQYVEVPTDLIAAAVERMSLGEPARPDYEIVCDSPAPEPTAEETPEAELARLRIESRIVWELVAMGSDVTPEYVRSLTARRMREPMTTEAALETARGTMQSTT